MEAFLLAYFIVAVLSLVAALWAARNVEEARSVRYLFASLVWALAWPVLWVVVIAVIRRNGKG